MDQPYFLEMVSDMKLWSFYGFRKEKGRLKWQKG